jgi:lysozyme family protein
MGVQGFDAAWAFTAPIEAGYCNDPADPGGETCFGITKRVARANGYMGEMKDMSAAMARSIGYSGYV